MNKGLNDALKRAKAYSRAGCDMILIHSKSRDTKELFKFSNQFKKVNTSYLLFVFHQRTHKLKKVN